MEGTTGKGKEERHVKERQDREWRKGIRRNDSQWNGGKILESTTGKGKYSIKLQ